MNKTIKHLLLFALVFCQMATAQIDLGETPTGTPPTEPQKTQIRASINAESPEGAQAKADAAQAAAALDATTKADIAEAAAIQRANHTGTQAQSTVDNLVADLAARSLIADIKNNLTSVDTDKPLSAAQGKALKDLVDAINTLLASDETTLDTLQEVVDYIQANRADIDALDIAAISGLQAALDLKAPLESPTFTIGGTTISATELSYLDGVADNLQTQINAKAPLASPSFTGDSLFTSASGNSGYTIRAIGTGSSSGQWKGRLITGGETVAFLMGEFNSKAWLGAHNAALNAWAPFYINPDGGEDLYLGFHGGSNILTIRNTNGYIGVKNGSPSEALDVTGNIKASGTLMLGSATWNGSTISGAQTASGQWELTGQSPTNSTSALNVAGFLSMIADDKYYIFREDWDGGFYRWTRSFTGSGGSGDSTGETGLHQLYTAGTINSTCNLYTSNGLTINPSVWTSWEFNDRSITSTSIADMKTQIGFFVGTSFQVGFEYDSALSANWRFWDAASATYTDTGVAVATDTAVSFKMRSTGTANQVYWSINGGSETLRTGVRDYYISVGTYLTNTAAVSKQLYKDFTSIIGTTSR